MILQQVVRLARELSEKTPEGPVTVRLECQEGDPRAELVILRDEQPWSQLACDFAEALELLASAHELFRARGHGVLRVEIVARKPWISCMDSRPACRSGDRRSEFAAS